jgi:hypothetical protein
MTLLRVALAIVLLASAATPQAPSASVEGVVLTADDRGAAVPGAAVEVSRVDQSPPQVYAAIADANGAFSIRGIRPGQYLLAARRAGYVEALYGQRRVRQPGVVMTLAAGQRLAGLRIPMTPAGVIHGRIYDRAGEPVGAAEVLALTIAYQDGVRALKAVQTTLSNDLGEYRLFNLSPGQYYISATPFPSPRPAVSTAGEVVRLVPDSLAAPRVPHYYPGTEDARRASAIDLQPGAVFGGGADFIVAQGPERHVRGAIRGGRAASLQLVPLNAIDGLTQRVTTVDQDTGTFDFAGVAPGNYILIARTEDAVSRQIIDVGDAGLNNVGLVFDGGIRIPGRVVFDDRAPADHDPDMDHIFFDIAISPQTQGVQADTYSPLFNGSFAFRDLIRGDYRITKFTVRNPTSVLRNAYLKSVRLGDRDVLNFGLQVTGPVEGVLEVVVGMRPSSLEGVVVNETGQPVPNATVVLANDTPSRSHLDLYYSGVTDASGRFLLDRLPPGRFKAFAWENIEDSAWQDPAVISPYETRGAPIQIRESTRETTRLVAIR